jgi:hypothetical protein
VSGWKFPSRQDWIKVSFTRRDDQGAEYVYGRCWVRPGSATIIPYGFERCDRMVAFGGRTFPIQHRLTVHALRKLLAA